MRSFKWLILVPVLGCLFLFRPPMTSVTADDEHRVILEREVDELEVLIERAIDNGKEEKAADLRRRRDMLLEELEEHEDGEEREQREEEIEMHIHELEIRRHAIDVEMAEMKLRMHRMELVSNPLATSLDAIDMASHHLEPEEAVEFFSELLEETTDFPVKQSLRRRLAELSFELDRREAAFQHLRRLIVPSDDCR